MIARTGTDYYDATDSIHDTDFILENFNDLACELEFYEDFKAILRSLLAALNSAIHVPQCIVVKPDFPRRTPQQCEYG